MVPTSSITGRVTDAAVTCGPAAWRHGWGRDDFDALAGAVVAGHVIECSAQATGGNYSFFDEIPGYDEVGGRARFGFPWAEVAADGSSVIGKHDGTGGAVTIGTVTSQLLYEIGGPEYLGPDVTARFDSIELEQVAPDRVRIAGVRGQAPPRTLKVAMNELGGYRNSFVVALTGLDIDEKARFAQAAFWDACPYGPDDFASVTSRVVRTDKADPATQEEATAVWRLTVKDPDERKVGRAFSDAMVHTALAGIPGMYGLGGGPSAGDPYGVYRPATVPAALVPAVRARARRRHGAGALRGPVGSGGGGDLARTGCRARRPDRTPPAGSGGGHPVGRQGRRRQPRRVHPQRRRLRLARPDCSPSSACASCCPRPRHLAIERHRFPRLRALNFVVHGLLDEGVAASTRQDAQAKALGEWLRARLVDVPVALADRRS